MGIPGSTGSTQPATPSSTSVHPLVLRHIRPHPLPIALLPGLPQAGLLILCDVSPAAELVHPVAVLRDLTTALEAAMTVAVADPTAKPVHRLRTTTRRIEAHVALLEYLGQIPADLTTVRHASKALRRIRRAAGRVRDLDVHAALLRACATHEPTQQNGSAAHNAPPIKRLRRDSDSLQALLQTRRAKQAKKLQRMLERKREKLSPVLEKLLKSLEAERDLTVSPALLRESTRKWFREREAKHTVPERSEEDLHATRKAAKMARYLAESSPETAGLAQQFEAVQESGGKWHDLLTLSEIAAAQLRRSSPLRATLKRDARAARDAYRAHLKVFRAGAKPRSQGKKRAA